MTSSSRQVFRAVIIILLCAPLTGCMYWWRAYQTYQQMSQFDRYFSIESSDDFTLHFKDPIMHSGDFVSLAKLHASEEMPLPTGKRWRYWFRKVDNKGKIVKPEISFYSDLKFNNKDRLTAWSFSSLFLEIAPPKFLEVSLRSIGGATINKEKMHLKADTSRIGKVNAPLPHKNTIVEKLGEPIKIKQEDGQTVFEYHFKLLARGIEAGYEDRQLTEINLTFAKDSDELTKMSGRFAGLKVSINYGDLVKKNNTVAVTSELTP